MTLKDLWILLKESWNAWSTDKAPRLGAALAYYTLFSLAPLLVIVIAVAALIFGQDAAQGKIVAEIQGLVGEESARAIQTMIDQARTPATGIVATILSLITLLLGATGVVGELKDTLNTIWHVQPAPEMGLLRTLKTRLASLAFVLGLGFLLLVSLVISAVLSALSGFFNNLFSSPWLLYALQVVNFVVSLGVITVLFAMLYRFLPDTEIPWRDVWIGAGMTALLFVISKFLIGLYLGRSSIASAYGTAGSLVLILVWVYYASLVLLFGAEFTAVYAHRYGSRAASTATERQRDTEALPLRRPLDSPPVVVPQGAPSTTSPGYGRYVTAALSFVAGMILGARRRARYP
jgi:membrane protein